MKVREARDLVEQITRVCNELEKKVWRTEPSDVNFLTAISYLIAYKKLIEQAIDDAEINI